MPRRHTPANHNTILPAPPNVDAKSQWRSLRYPPITALVVCSIWLLAAARIWESYDTTIEDWTSTGERTASVAAEFAASWINSADIVLQTLQDWVAAERVQTKEEFHDVFTQRRYFEKLRDRVAGLPQVDVATFIDAKGKVLLFSRSYPAPDIDLWDRDYFRAQVARQPPPTSLGNAVRNRGTGQWTFYKAKQVRAPDGVILGVFIVGIEANFFEQFARRIAAFSDGSVGFWRNDATLLSVWPHNEEGLGNRYPTAISTSILKEHPQGATTWVNSKRLFWHSTEQSRLLVVRPVEKQPAYVTVASGASEILTRWKVTRNRTAVAAAVVPLLVV